MIIETIVWILFTIFIVWLSAVKTKHFMKEKSFKRSVKEYEAMKAKPSLTKTIDDKMDYLRQKTNSGNDVMTVVISSIIFIIGFIVLAYSKVPNFSIGIIVALTFSLIFAFIFARLQFTKAIMEYKFIDAFIGYLFASMFMIYVKFIHNIPLLLLLGISIAIMIFVNKYINRWVGNE